MLHGSGHIQTETRAFESHSRGTSETLGQESHYYYQVRVRRLSNTQGGRNGTENDRGGGEKISGCHKSGVAGLNDFGAPTR
jgi:hypothetical protein